MNTHNPILQVSLLFLLFPSLLSNERFPYSETLQLNSISIQLLTLFFNLPPIGCPRVPSFLLALHYRNAALSMLELEGSWVSVWRHIKLVAAVACHLLDVVSVGVGRIYLLGIVWSLWCNRLLRVIEEVGLALTGGFNRRDYFHLSRFEFNLLGWVPLEIWFGSLKLLVFTRMERDTLLSSLLSLLAFLLVTYIFFISTRAGGF